MRKSFQLRLVPEKSMRQRRRRPAIKNISRRSQTCHRITPKWPPARANPTSKPSQMWKTTSSQVNSSPRTLLSLKVRSSQSKRSKANPSLNQNLNPTPRAPTLYQTLQNRASKDIPRSDLILQESSKAVQHVITPIQNQNERIL